MNEPARLRSEEGLSIAYETGGAGPAVVLVHGFASSRSINWKNTGWFARLTEAGFFVAALDLRGHGQSDKPHDIEAYRLSRFVSDLGRLLDRLNVATAALVGYSMGAQIALAFHMAHPHRVSKLALGGFAPPPRDPTARERVIQGLLAPDPQRISDEGARYFRLFADRGSNDNVALAACFRGVQEPVDMAALAHIAVPVLVVAGARDTAIGDPLAFARAMPNAQTLILPERDHMTASGDKRHQEAVAAFLHQS